MVAVRRFGLALTFGLFLLGSCCFLVVALVQGAFVLRELRLDTAGVAATGIVTATHTCTYTIDTSDTVRDEQITGETLTVRYTDQRGTEHVAETHMCLQQSYTVGAQVPIHYLPDDPGTIATEGELESVRGLFFLDIVVLVGMVVFAAMMLWAFVRGLRLVRQAQRQRLASLPPYQDAPIPRIVARKREPWELP